MKTTICKCDLCGKIVGENELYTYGHQHNTDMVVEVEVCENCLFDIVGSDFCDGDFL